MRAVILNLFLINLLFAQTYRLEGEILDASNKSALPFANVILEGTTLGSASVLMASSASRKLMQAPTL